MTDSSDHTDARRAAGRTAALLAADLIVEDFGSHRRDEYFQRFADDATFLFHTHPVRLESREEYERLWRGWEEENGFRVHGCSSTGRRIDVYGDTAIFSHDVTTDATFDGVRETALERESIILVLRDGAWVAVHEHLSAASPPGEE